MQGKFSVFAVFLALTAPAPLFSQNGPGIPANTYQASELFKPLSTIHSPSGTSWGNGNMIHGYLVVGVDKGEDSTGLLMYDISNPRQPRLAGQKYDAESKRLREIQDFTFVTLEGRDYAAIPSHAGVEIWDFTDALAPRRVSALSIVNGGGAGIYNGVIYTFWQPPYIYCGGQNNGFYVVNASNINSLSVTRRVNNVDLNGYLIGGVFALGNRLVVTTMQQGATGGGGFATYDISNPTNPQFLDFFNEPGANYGQYTSIFNGGKIFGHGVGGYLQVYNVAQNGQITAANRSTSVSGRGGYGQFQDGFLHAGMSSEYVKYDVRGATPQIVGRYSVAGDNDWAFVLGNLVFVADDDGPASAAAIVPHQTAPDRTGPMVNGRWPADGAVNEPLTTRVGLSFSDNVDFASLGPESFTLTRVGGAAVSGTFSLQAGLANFTPDEPLEPGSIYETRVVAGGVCDFSGNPIREDFRSRFSTGSAVFIRAGKSRILRVKGSFTCSLTGRCGNGTNFRGSLRFSPVLLP
jgi:hypothetical protein